MGLRADQWGELIGILLLLASTATQIFYVEPLKRQIEWRLAAFSNQQNGRIVAETTYDNRITLLRALKADAGAIAAAEQGRKTLVEKYQTADANVANYILSKEWIENVLQIIVVALFACGSLLAGIGRAFEMAAARQAT